MRLRATSDAVDSEEFVPHIRKEDKDFFIPVMAYFSEAEQDAMLDEMWESDRDMIHEKYEDVVEALENSA
jgi:hemerythrin-like domain-containing protein